MDHIPMYRARAQRNPAPALPLWRSASIVSAAAALTLTGIALGYHGLGDMSPAVEQVAQTAHAEIAIPVPKIAFPTVTSGHPDVLAQLSTALLARLPIAPPSVTALRPPALPAFVAPTLEPFVLSVEVAPAAEVSAANLDVPDDATVVARAPRVVSAPVQLAARSVAAPAQVEVAGVIAEAEPTLEAASVATPEPTPPPQPQPAPAVAKRAPTPAPVPAPKLPAKAPAQPLQHKDPPAETRPKPQANADDGKKKEDPKPQAQPQSQSHPAPDGVARNQRPRGASIEKFDTPIEKDR